MVQFDNNSRQIKVKIVYYGPALGGKTTSLQAIHRATAPDRRTKLYSLATANDRTLFFDLFSLDLGSIRGYKVALQLYTVPGQVAYNVTRRAVLAGVDAVVFVADSLFDQENANLESLKNLDENLRTNGVDPESIPFVLQFNKRDLPKTQSIAQMDQLLNSRGVPSFPTTATIGDGVMEAFKAVTSLTLSTVALKVGLKDKPQSVRRLQEQLDTALNPFMPMTKIKPAVSFSTTKGIPTPVLENDELINEAVRANVAMTDLNTELEHIQYQLKRKVDILSAITKYGHMLSAVREPRKVLESLVASACRELKAHASAIIFPNQYNALNEVLITGFSEDPLLHTNGEIGEPLVVDILMKGKPVLINRDIDRADDSMRLRALESTGLGSGLAIPLNSDNLGNGLLTLFRQSSAKDFDEDDSILAVLMANTAILAHDKASSWQRMKGFNDELEQQVKDRTREVHERGALLEKAYGELEELDRVKSELLTRISHELRTPITSLTSAAQILERYHKPADDKSSRFITIISEESAKLNEIIQSVIQASMLARNAEPSASTLVEIRTLLKDAFSPIRELALEKNITIRVHAPSGGLHIHCDPEGIGEALRAVIKNAVQFSDEASTITINAKTNGANGSKTAVITIVDSGPGIPGEDLSHVFETFWQGGDLLTGKPPGIGLGLAIAKRVIEGHGGTIGITSEIGKGTEVTMSLPAK